VPSIAVGGKSWLASGKIGGGPPHGINQHDPEGTGRVKRASGITAGA